MTETETNERETMRKIAENDMRGKRKKNSTKSGAGGGKVAENEKRSIAALRSAKSLDKKRKVTGNGKR